MVRFFDVNKLVNPTNLRCDVSVRKFSNLGCSAWRHGGGGDESVVTDAGTDAGPSAGDRSSPETVRETAPRLGSYAGERLSRQDRDVSYRDVSQSHGERERRACS